MDNSARNDRFELLWAYYAIQNSSGIAALISSKEVAFLFGSHSYELRIGALFKTPKSGAAAWSAVNLIEKEAQARQRSN